MKGILMKWFNYFFPLENYEGKAITDAKWVQRLTPRSPYLALYVAAVLLVVGTIFPTETTFFLRPQIIVSLGIAFWFCIFSYTVKLLRKHQRNTTFLHLIVNFTVLRGIFALVLFMGINSILKDAQKDIQAKHQAISQEVQQKIQSTRSRLDAGSHRNEWGVAELRKRFGLDMREKTDAEKMEKKETRTP